MWIEFRELPIGYSFIIYEEGIIAVGYIKISETHAENAKGEKTYFSPIKEVWIPRYNERK